MKRLFFLALLSFGGFNLAGGTLVNPLEASSQGSLSWKRDYKAALAEAESTGKPLFLFFTGSDWCSWCKKLESEVFQRPEFAQALSDKFIFVELDFPRGSAANSFKAQNDELQKKFKVTGFPTIVIVSSKGALLGTMGYKAGGPKVFIEALERYTHS
jgi:Thioredoxin-related protein